MVVRKTVWAIAGMLGLHDEHGRPDPSVAIVPVPEGTTLGSVICPTCNSVGGFAHLRAVITERVARDVNDDYDQTDIVVEAYCFGCEQSQPVALVDLIVKADDEDDRRAQALETYDPERDDG